MNERLLTLEERSAACMGKRPARKGDHMARVLSHNVEDAMLEAQDKKTLKAVGEWLESKERKVDCLDGQISRGFLITPEDIDSLKKGELPE